MTKLFSEKRYFTQYADFFNFIYSTIERERMRRYTFTVTIWIYTSTHTFSCTARENVISWYSYSKWIYYAAHAQPFLYILREPERQCLPTLRNNEVPQKKNINWDKWTRNYQEMQSERVNKHRPLAVFPWETFPHVFPLYRMPGFRCQTTRLYIGLVKPNRKILYHFFVNYYDYFWSPSIRATRWNEFCRASCVTRDLSAHIY